MSHHYENIVEFLKNVRWLRRTHQAYWRFKTMCFSVIPCCLPTMMRYRKRLHEVRAAYSRRPLRVLFLVGNLTKWKMQSLLDEMRKSDRFEPIVALTIMDIENDLPVEEKRMLLSSTGRYFAAQNIPILYAYDCDKNEAVPLKNFHPDIVFYQQPWRIAKCQDPIEVSRYALTCYVPYFVVNYGGLDRDCELIFHRVLWRHFILNECWAKVFMRDQHWYGRAGKVIATGHPMLDDFYLRKNEAAGQKYVIYAPHWSCNTGERYSTFLENGRLILDLARRNPEIQWVFKPHPSLRYVLINVHGWAEREVDAYYDEWGKIGKICLDGEYVKLFRDSIAMITDCASFLIEYACSGRPIIHLCSSNPQYEVHPISKALFSTYYQAHNWNEFSKHFNDVVLVRNDYKYEERIAAVSRMRLLDNYAAKNILNHLNHELSGEEVFEA